MAEQGAVIPKSMLRAGTKQGTKHVRLGYNNQDAHVFQSFSIPALKRNYSVGLVADGCSGQPSFSHTEVGAHLITLYAYRRIQELVCSRLSIDQIPMVLYSSITEYLLDLMTKIMPQHIVWKYPIKYAERESWDAQTRFKTDYLAATLLGFVSDGESVVTFTAGDGIILVNDDLKIIDQNDLPDYPVSSLNKSGKGFETAIYPARDVQRLAVSTDGLAKLITEAEFRNKVFDFKKDSVLGLQQLLNATSQERPELMLDDCTIVAFETRKE